MDLMDMQSFAFWVKEGELLVISELIDVWLCKEYLDPYPISWHLLDDNNQ